MLITYGFIWRIRQFFPLRFVGTKWSIAGCKSFFGGGGAIAFLCYNKHHYELTTLLYSEQFFGSFGYAKNEPIWSWFVIVVGVVGVGVGVGIGVCVCGQFTSYFQNGCPFYDTTVFIWRQLQILSFTIIFYNYELHNNNVTKVINTLKIHSVFYLYKAKWAQVHKDLFLLLKEHNVDG